jgi:carbon starvation protein
MQDLLGQITPVLGHTGTLLSNVTASIIFCSAWGWFLIQGVIDPRGGVNSLLPIFGIANQLLAVIALSLGTTIMIKMGKARYIWVTLVPLAWLFAVTMSAGLLKIFSADPRIGFIAEAKSYSVQIAAGATGENLLRLRDLVVNDYINVTVCAVFMSLVLLIVCACVREWYLLLSKKKASVLCESPYVKLETV